ncbi:histidine kinase dimerization/phosphoacceptor domain-containing protein [Microbacterium sp. oral taxon 186]|uniref:histidine kinase dimerization/phosphoacceptor domain-containing protein n=1 Tax=Microbacterium sp. oral taxon 186 TaxID=712383 RepID=UPI0003A2C7C3|nr:histidine kinase dimerization/phosphoacceptor domain-containing protein [Microbacterium sp. oral taxon 186]
MIRRFWARHPRLTDVIVALLTALVTFPAPGREDFAGDARLWTGVRPIVVVVLTLACVAMLWRRRLPLVPFSLAAVGAVLAVSSGAGVGAATTAVAVYAVAVYAGSSAAWIASGIVVGGAAMAAGVTVLVGVLPWSTAVNGCAALAVGLLVGCLVGVNVGNRARYVAALMETSRRLWAERAQQAQLAAATERARIAREMHDVVSHSLTVMVALAEGATATDDAPRARAATAQIATTGRGGRSTRCAPCWVCCEMATPSGRRWRRSTATPSVTPSRPPEARACPSCCGPPVARFQISPYAWPSRAWCRRV